MPVWSILTAAQEDWVINLTVIHRRDCNILEPDLPVTMSVGMTLAIGVIIQEHIPPARIICMPGSQRKLVAALVTL